MTILKAPISSIKLNLFKGFKDTNILFEPGLNLLVGGNNSGKSTILHSIYLAFYFLRLTNGISNPDKKKGKTKTHLQGTTVRSVPLPFHDEAYISEGLKKRTIREKSTRMVVTIAELHGSLEFMETLTFPGGNLLVISSDNKGNAGNAKYQKKIQSFISNEKNLPLYIPTFSGVVHKEEERTKEVVKHYIASGKSSEVLRNQLSKMSSRQMKQINAYLKKSFNYEITKQSENKEIYLSSFYKEGEYNNLDISSAGSGFQQILQILVFIVISGSDIILIDEPDAHLHYKLQNILYSILSDLAKEGKQIIVATHSQVFIKKAIQNSARLLLVDKSLQYQKPISEYKEGVKQLYASGLIDETDITQGVSLN